MGYNKRDDPFRNVDYLIRMRNMMTKEEFVAMMQEEAARKKEQRRKEFELYIAKYKLEDAKSTAKYKPNNVYAQLKAANLCFEMGIWSSSITYYKKALKIYPGNAVLIHDLGIAYIQKGDYDKAITLLKKAIKASPDEPELYLAMALAYDNSEDWDQAIHFYKEVIRINRNYSAEAYYNLGHILEHRDNIDQAVKVFGAAAALKSIKANSIYNKPGGKFEFKKTMDAIPDDFKVCFARAVQYENNKEWEKAIRFYKEALAIYPEYAEAYYKMGRIFEKHYNRPDLAIKAFKKATGFDPNQTKKPTCRKTIDILKKIIEPPPSDYYTCFSMAMTYDNCKEWEQAIRLYKETVRLNPGYAKAYYKMGLIYYNHYSDQPELAIEAFKKAAASDPNNPDAHHMLGSAYFKKEEIELALKAYFTALKIDPNLPNIYGNIGNAYINLGCEVDNGIWYWKKAVRFLKKAITFDPNGVWLYYNLGIVYGNLHLYNLAIDAYRHSIALDPNDPDTYYRLGGACCSANRKELAMNAYQKLVEMNYYLAPMLLREINEHFIS